MKKYKVPVRFTGQHFTVDPILIHDAIRLADIKVNDMVLDIGAGKGFLTVHLSRYAGYVIAIEKDIALVTYLKQKFRHTANVELVGSDFRKYEIPKVDFKVVSNIPYGITADILRTLMFIHVENFAGGCLIMQLEPARKLLSGKVFNPYVVFYHTFFDLKLVYEVAAESFMPPPKVKSALLKIEKKQCPGVDVGMKEKYLDFLFFMLHKPDTPVLTGLKKIFRKNQVREMAEKRGIKLNSRMTDLSVMQWSDCFKDMLDVVPEKFHPKR